MKVVLSQINFTRGSAPTVSVTYTATLPVRDETVDFLAALAWTCGGLASMPNLQRMQAAIRVCHERGEEFDVGKSF